MAFVWQFSAIELNDAVWVNGTLLKGNYRRKTPHRTLLGHFFQVLSSYFQRPARGRILEIRTSAEKKQVKCGKKGQFSLQVKKCPLSSIQLFYKDTHLQLPEDYPLAFPLRSSPVEVISDLDDTVLYSHTSSVLKRMYHILFVLPRKRKPILYTYELFQFFEEKDFQINYLSKSESNLFGLISTFIMRQELPKGALLLTPYLRMHQLFKPNKGRDYKYDHLKTMLDGMPGKRFILLGDDSQRDMEIYSDIVSKYKDRIIKVFIRQTGFGRSEKQLELWERLKATQVNAVYFNDGDEARTEIEDLAFLSETEYADIDGSQSR
jgi:hypothetical protein